MMKKPEQFGKNTVSWLDSNFVTNKHTLNYSEGTKAVGKLLGIAAQARNELELYLPKISEKRGDVKYDFNLYKSSLQRIISIVENAHSQLVELRPAFAKTHSSAELASYDRRIAFMEQRLLELRQDAKWVPRELKGYKPRDVEINAETEIASLKPFKADMVFTRAEAARNAMEQRLASLPKKMLQQAAKSSSAKASEAMVFTLEENEEYRRKHTAPPAQKPARKGAAEKVAMAEPMVFTPEENEEYRRAHLSIPALKKQKGTSVMVFTMEELALQGKIKKLTAQIKNAKDEHKPMKVRALRMERKEAWLRYSELTGERPPKHILSV